MELNKIRIILDDSGNIDSLVTPVINQYATNYLVEVAFINEYDDNRIYKVVFNINGKESPAKVLAPTDRYYDFGDGTKSAHFWEYKLTQYETQFYQDALEFTLIVENDVNIITTQKISLVMNKQRFNKLTPVNLEGETSLDSVGYSISNLDKVIDSRISTSETEILEEVNRLDGVVRADLTNRITGEINDVHTRIDGVEDYFSSEIVRIDADINAGDTRLDEKIDNAVNEAAEYTDRQLLAYDGYAHDMFITGDDVQQDLYPYIDRKTAEAKSYTDEKITELVDSAPGTLNTLREIAEALEGQDDVITALEETIGNKADRDELDSKVSKVGDRNVLYGTDENGAEYYLTYSEYADGNARIPLRSSTGQLDVPEEPYSERDAASKKYVDDTVAAMGDTKLDKPTKDNNYSRIPWVRYGENSFKYRTLGTTVADGMKNGWVAVYNPANRDTRMPDGQLATGIPQYDGDCANKKYVDTLFNGAVVEITDTEVTLDMESNKEYRCTAETGITSLNINSFVAAPSGVREEWTIIYKTGSPITVNLPSNIKWAIANPVFSANKTYMITFIRFGEYFIGIWSVEG